MARKDESLQQPRPFVYIFCPDRAFSATKTAGTRDPGYVQQDLELELRATNAAGCTLGHIWRTGGKGKMDIFWTKSKKPRHNLSHRPIHRPPRPSLDTDALPCAVIVDELGLHRPPRHKKHCSQGERQRRCYHAITRISQASDWSDDETIKS